jgi:dihydrofolate reductase
MAKLIYSAITSLDGYTVDATGSFDWAAPSEELHAFVNDLERPVGSYLYGRRMYDTMHVWETMGELSATPVILDYAQIWRAANKIVYSTTLTTVSSAKTRIERDFDVDVVRELTSSALADVSIGGATLAAQALRAGLVDEIHQFVTPVVVGGGQRFLPDGVRLQLELLDERRFDSGVVHLHYLVVTSRR